MMDLYCKQSPLIILSEIDNAGLILSVQSGIHYQNQTCGTACYQDEIEGVYIPIDGEGRNIDESLYKHFTGSKYNGWGAPNGIDSNDADIIDDILNKNYCSMIKVDRSKLKESHEAWVHIKIENNPDRIRLYGDFGPDTPDNHHLHMVFCGFNGYTGVLTWTNSD